MLYCKERDHKYAKQFQVQDLMFVWPCITNTITQTTK